jgi:hypothetical protein
MKKRVEYEISNYYMKILRTFLSRAEIGKRMTPAVSHAAVQRWESGMTNMDEASFRRLHDVLLNLAHEFEKIDKGQQDGGSFFSDLAVLIRSAVNDGPEVRYRPPGRKRSKTINALTDRLIDLLHGKSRRSASVIETLVEEGYSGAQVQRAAKIVGVKKTVVGFGSKRRSSWSLKKDG